MPKDLAAILAVDQNYGIGYKNNILNGGLEVSAKFVF